MLDEVFAATATASSTLCDVPCGRTGLSAYIAWNSPQLLSIPTVWEFRNRGKQIAAR